MKLEFPERLSEKYRPKTIGGFVGLPKVKRVLKAFIARPRSSGWLFLGPLGCGKTTMALALCAELGAELHHIPSRECDLERVTWLAMICHYVPLSGGFHFILVDEADAVTLAAQQALLSKLDATAFPPKTIFVFTTNSTMTFDPRLLSRLMTLHFDDQGMSQELPRYLARVAKREGIRDGLNYAEVALRHNYNVRDALNTLELESLGAGYLRKGA